MNSNSENISVEEFLLFLMSFRWINENIFLHTVKLTFSQSWFTILYTDNDWHLITFNNVWFVRIQKLKHYKLFPSILY